MRSNGNSIWLKRLGVFKSFRWEVYAEGVSMMTVIVGILFSFDGFSMIVFVGSLFSLRFFSLSHYSNCSLQVVSTDTSQMLPWPYLNH